MVNAGAQRSNSAEFSTEQTGSQCRNNKQHPVTFQNKTFRVDTSTQISKKRQIQAILLIIRSETLRVVVFNYTDL